ncbi:MAG: (d)CMP kinase [Bernardetiaceae bacterium]
MKKEVPKISIAVDGYAGCGKSTSAREVARRLHYIYLDTGAMYRAVTLYFLRKELDWNDAATVQEALLDIAITFGERPRVGESPVFLNGENVSKEIRSMTVTQSVSQVSAVPEIRRFLVAQQQRIGLGKGVVAEGRDIGTVVFPDAEVKVFMQASMEARVSRRQEQLREQGYTDISLEQIEENLQKRDYLDTTRADSPLRKAADAHTLDTSETTFEEQVQYILSLVETTLAVIPQ